MQQGLFDLPGFNRRYYVTARAGLCRSFSKGFIGNARTKNNGCISVECPNLFAELEGHALAKRRVYQIKVEIGIFGEPQYFRGQACPYHVVTAWLKCDVRGHRGVPGVIDIQDVFSKRHSGLHDYAPVKDHEPFTNLLEHPSCSS